MNKKVKGFLYSLPFIVSSVLPSQKANAQIDFITPNTWHAPQPNDMEKPNTIYFGFQPIDLGVGMGYSKKITPNFGTYISFSRGKYRDPLSLNQDEFKQYFIDHYKISLGTNIHSRKDRSNSSGFISLGASYGIFNTENYPKENMDEKVLKKWSFEFGAGITLGDKLTTGFLFDPIKGESNIYLGIPF